MVGAGHRRGGPRRAGVAGLHAGGIPRPRLLPAVVQADDLKTRVEEWGWRDYVWSYLGRAAWYTAVTLVTAQIARSHISA